MSGGSFNYLCRRELEGAAYYTDDMEAMRDFLASLGYADDAVTATQAVIDGIAALKAQIETLYDVWMGAEWWQSGDIDENGFRSALERFRKKAGGECA